jgi:hypothetical protein
MAVNVRGAMLCIKYAVPRMRARGGGSHHQHVVADGPQGHADAQRLHGEQVRVLGITDAVSQEVGVAHIRVNALCPGAVNGELMQRVIAARVKAEGRSAGHHPPNYTDKASLRRGSSRRRSRRRAVPREPASAAITGERMRVDAGGLRPTLRATDHPHLRRHRQPHDARAESRASGDAREIAQSAVEAARAGAAIVHLHARDPAHRTRHDARGALRRDRRAHPRRRLRRRSSTCPRAKAAASSRPTTIRRSRPPGSTLMRPELRVAHVERLRPEVCTLDFNTMYSGTAVVINTPRNLEIMAQRVLAAGVVPSSRSSTRRPAARAELHRARHPAWPAHVADRARRALRRDGRSRIR